MMEKEEIKKKIEFFKYQRDSLKLRQELITKELEMAILNLEYYEERLNQNKYE